jgi:hypothetical protein
MTNINKRGADTRPPINWLKLEADIFNQHVNNALMGGAKLSFWAFFMAISNMYDTHYFASLKDERAARTGHAQNRSSTPATKPSLLRPSLG